MRSKFHTPWNFSLETNDGQDLLSEGAGGASLASLCPELLGLCGLPQRARPPLSRMRFEHCSWLLSLLPEALGVSGSPLRPLIVFLPQLKLTPMALVVFN